MRSLPTAARAASPAPPVPWLGVGSSAACKDVEAAANVDALRPARGATKSFFAALAVSSSAVQGDARRGLRLRTWGKNTSPLPPWACSSQTRPYSASSSPFFLHFHPSRTADFSSSLRAPPSPTPLFLLSLFLVCRHRVCDRKTKPSPFKATPPACCIWEQEPSRDSQRRLPLPHEKRSPLRVGLGIVLQRVGRPEPATLR